MIKKIEKLKFGEIEHIIFDSGSLSEDCANKEELK